MEFESLLLNVGFINKLTAGLLARLHTLRGLSTMKNRLSDPPYLQDKDHCLIK